MVVKTTQVYGELTVVKEVDDENGDIEITVEGLNMPSHWVGCERRG